MSTNAYALSKVRLQRDGGVWFQLGSLVAYFQPEVFLLYNYVIGSFFYFTNQNLVIQYGSDGKWKLSWHIFACLVFLFPAFLLFFFFANRVPLTGSCQGYYIGCFNFIYCTSFLRRGWGKGWNAWHGICRNDTA